MSIDYDRLRELVNTSESTDVPLINRIRATTDLENLAPDIARELLRLRDGVEVIRDRCAGLGLKAEYAPNIPAKTAYRVAEQLLTGLLNGDTE